MNPQSKHVLPLSVPCILYADLIIKAVLKQSDKIIDPTQ